MSTLLQSLAKTRLLLRDPRPQRPGEREVLDAVTREYQSLFNRLNNSGQAWTIDEVTLNVFQGQEDYLLEADSGFTKPLSVITRDSSNPSHVERQVDFFEIANVDFDWNLPNDIGSAFLNIDGSTHTAARMAFFRRSGLEGGVYVRVKPVPQDSAQYRVLYAVGNWASSAALADQAILSEHHHLVETRAALSLLPDCEWWDDEDENRIRRKELFALRTTQEGRYAEEFERYIRSVNRQGMSFRSGYGGY